MYDWGPARVREIPAVRAEAGPYIAADIATACRGVVVSGDPGVRFNAICTDSREIRQHDLFVPLVGPNFDGHDFVLSALEAGARGSLCHRDVNREILKHPSKHVLIQVKDTLHALSDLASAHRKKHTLPLIAVTGSSGKTTVKEMIAAVLGRSQRPLVSQGNLNNMIGLPMTVLNLGPHYTSAVVEAGINRNGEMEHLARAATPDVAVVTTIGPVHLEGLGSVETVAREKFKLVRSLPSGGMAVLPADNPYLEPLIAECPGRAVFFGIENGDFLASHISLGDQTVFEMTSPYGTVQVRLQAPGGHSVLNALAAAAACLSVGASLDDLCEGLSDFRPPAMRMELVPLSGNRILIRDCYNANPQSVEAALEVLANKGRGLKTLAILGDMAELGENSESLHEKVGENAARLGVNRLIFVGAHGKSFQDGFMSAGDNRGTLQWFENKEEAWDTVKPDLKSFDVILVKGSRVMKMETIADRILQEK
jgi:UDP-N-acetylmuramoyl-tripeptide--D-alanyl-D-alanine ligase